jgi:predicted lipoprotein with Yx(FWY)xxD motif
MNRLRTTSVIRMTGVVVVVLALLASACNKSNDTSSGGTTGGSTTGGSTTGGSTTSPTTGPTTGSTSGSGSKATVSAKNAGSLGMVLVDSRGFTLYHLTGESKSKITCTDQCVAAWPPLEASGTPSGGAGATGTLTTIMRPDGKSQVAYDGLPLYTFSGDTAPGQTNGQGIQGAWFAVTPAGEDAKGGSGGANDASPTGGGYGGY